LAPSAAEGEIIMAIAKYSAALLAAGILAVQPCAAADDFRDFNPTHRRTSAFAGMNVRLPLDRGTPAKPSARLQLTSAYSSMDARTGAVQTFKAQGLELGAGLKGKPALFLNGQNTAEMKQKLQVKGSTGTILLVAGGILLVLVLVAAASVPPQVDFDD
jgi:hypothetical protein